MKKKQYQIGISAILPNEDDSNVRWTDQTVEAENEIQAESLATDLGYYRNVRIREVEST
jgi:hypothetical protein